MNRHKLGISSERFWTRVSKASINLNPAVANAGAAREEQFHCGAQLLRASPNG